MKKGVPSGGGDRGDSVGCGEGVGVEVGLGLGEGLGDDAGEGVVPEEELELAEVSEVPEFDGELFRVIVSEDVEIKPASSTI